MARIRVLIVDDSALMRELLREILSRDRNIEVVGAAADPYAAWAKIKATNPDVLTLDVEMPRMDGVTFLEKLMGVRPLPVLMVSSLTTHGCDVTLRALEAGAIDFVAKPKLDVAEGVNLVADEILLKVKTAARARVRKRVQTPAKSTQVKPLRFRNVVLSGGTEKIIAIGASTGGTEALREVLTQMPPDAPGIVVVQHMPERFTTSFSKRLDELCQITVKEAADGDRVLPGHAYIAPGSFHTEIQRSGGRYMLKVYAGEPVNLHRPSVDVLFDSCADRVGSNAVGVILTGMGADGAAGLLKMKKAGARTIAQNEATCVVFGMPKEAIKCGGVDEILPIGEIAGAALNLTAV